MSQSRNCDSQDSFSDSAMTPINVVVAHGLEAKPVIAMLNLRPVQSETKYLEYTNSSGITLIVSGIGREAVTAAVRFLGERQGNENGQLRAWLNLGIAGHKTAEIGSGWLANKITEHVSGSSSYPPQLLEGFSSRRVITVDEPENVYTEDAAYEMESSAFYETATQFSTAELVQVFKIVSDNALSPVSRVDLKMVPTWIAAQENSILDLIAKLKALVVDHNISHSLPSFYQEIRANYHLSVSQLIQLRRLCQRYKAMGKEEDLRAISASTTATGKQLLQKLLSCLEEVKPR